MNRRKNIIITLSLFIILLASQGVSEPVNTQYSEDGNAMMDLSMETPRVKSSTGVSSNFNYDFEKSGNDWKVVYCHKDYSEYQKLPDTKLSDETAKSDYTDIPVKAYLGSPTGFSTKISGNNECNFFTFAGIEGDAIKIGTNSTIIEIQEDNATFTVSPENVTCEYLYCESEISIINNNNYSIEFNSTNLLVDVENNPLTSIMIKDYQTLLEVNNYYLNESTNWVLNGTKNMTLTSNKDASLNLLVSIPAYETQTFVLQTTFNETNIKSKYNVTLTYKGINYTIDPTFETSSSNFENGVFFQTFLNASGFVQLNLTEGFTTGNYTSEITDAFYTATWNNISFGTSAFGEAPNTSDLTNEAETKWASGNLNFSNPYLYWRFNNDSNYGENDSIVYDYSGTGNNGTPNGNAAPNLTDKKLGEGSYTFDGDSDYVSNVNSDDPFVGVDFTVMAWINKRSDISGLQRAVVSRHASSSTKNFELGVYTNQTVIFQTFDACGGNAVDLFSTETIDTGEWYHITWMLDSGNLKYIFINGTQVVNSSSTPTVPNCANQATSIGARIRNVAGTSWPGLIDEVVIFSRTLTEQEIQDHYKRGVTRLNVSVRSCNDAACDGESFSEIDNLDTSLQSLSVSDNRYFQYTWDFNTTDNIYSPELYNVSVGYNITDISEPVISLEDPSNNYIEELDNTPTFWFNATDEAVQTLECTLWLNATASGTPTSYGTDTSVTNQANTSITANSSLSNNDYWWWINCSDETNTNVSIQRNISINLETVNPSVDTLLPTTGTIYNVLDTFEIAANVTDATAVSQVFANVTYPNATIKEFELLNGSDHDNKFNASFNTTLAGNYSVLFIANDSSSNINSTESTAFDIDYNFSFFTNNNTGSLLRFGYANGTRNNLIWNWSNNSLQLNDLTSNGSYISPIFDATSNSTWNNISWLSNVGELPSNKVDDGVIDMTNNTALFHFNNDSSFEENDSLAYDFSGNQNNATCGGTTCPIYNLTDKKFGDSSMTFDGNDDFLAAGEILNTVEYTKTAWVKRTTGAVSNNIASGDTTTGGHAFWAPAATYRLSAGHNGDWTFIQDPVALAVDTWYFVAVTYNSGTTNMTLYKDGVKVDSDTGSAAVTDPTVQIGGFLSDNEWIGNIDEVAIWERTLTPDEILNLYKRGVTKFNASVRTCDDAVCDTETWTDINDTSPQQLSSGYSLDENRYFQYNFTFETEDTSYTPELYNVSIEYADIASEDTINPSVGTLVPAINSVFNITNTIEINATVTDDIAVSQVFANISYPNGTLEQYELILDGSNVYNTTFTIEELTGTYNITFIANDTSGNINSSETSNFTVDIGCATITKSTTLTQDLSSSGTCMIIGASDITLDCAGYTITYNTAGGSSAYGVDNQGSYNQTTIKNCIIQKTSTSGTSGHGIVFLGNTNSTILNNTINLTGSGTNIGIKYNNGVTNTTINLNRIYTTGSGASNVGLSIETNSDNHTISNNFVSTNGTATNHALLLEGAYNLIENNDFITNGTENENFGVDMSGSNTFENTFRGNNFTTEGGTGNKGVSFDGTGDNCTLEENSFITNGNGLSLISSIEGTLLINNNFTVLDGSLTIIDSSGTGTNNTLIYNNSFGQINWTLNNLTTNITLKVSDTVFLSNNLIGLTDNSEALNLNSSTRIELRKLTNVHSAPPLLKDGIRCDDTANCNISWDDSSKILFANVTSFSNYSANFSECGVLNSDTTLINNVNSTGSCFTFNNSNIELNCNGYNISYNSGGTAVVGIEAVGFNNINVTSCNVIPQTNGLTAKGLNVSNSTDLFVFNNSFESISTDFAIYLSDVNNTNFTNNYVNSSFGAVFGDERLYTGSIENNNFTTKQSNGLILDLNDFNITNNQIIDIKTGSGTASAMTLDGNNSYFAYNNFSSLQNLGQTVSLNPASANIFEENTFSSQGSTCSAIDLFRGSSGEIEDNIFLNNNFTSNFEVITDDSDSSENNTIIYNNSFGQINWTLNNLTTRQNLSINTTIFIENNLVGLDTQSVTEQLNSSAQIEIRNISFSNPQLLKDGVRCDDTDECNITYDSSSLTVFANISSFSNYTTRQAPSPPIVSPVSGGNGGGNYLECPEGQHLENNFCVDDKIEVTEITVDLGDATESIIDLIQENSQQIGENIQNNIEFITDTVSDTIEQTKENIGEINYKLILFVFGSIVLILVILGFAYLFNDEDQF